MAAPDTADGAAKMRLLDAERLVALKQRVAKEVREGFLPATQFAVGLDGAVVAHESFGTADNDTRFYGFSCHKAITNAAVWALAAQGQVDFEKPVMAYLDDFGTHGKDAITVEQLLLLTAGIAEAQVDPAVAQTAAGRRATFRDWVPETVPGTHFAYHAVSAHWVLAEIIQTVTGRHYAEAIHDLVTAPLGLRRTLGLPESDTGPFALPVVVSEPASPEELAVHFTGVAPQPLFSAAVFDEMRSPRWRALGIPGGGGLMTAADLATLYQAFLHDPQQQWEGVLEDCTRVVRNTFPHPWWGVPANRTRGMNVAGDDGHGPKRNLGNLTAPATFGTAGAFGQLSWADPASGISFAYLTSGLDLHEPRLYARCQEISDLAARLLTPAS